MVLYDNYENVTNPIGFPVEGGNFHIILVTHDKPTFYTYDHQRNQWSHKNNKAVPQAKGEGQSLMISDFLISEWGRLVDGDE